MEALPSGALEKIRAVLARHPEVISAVLFGSRAKGIHRDASDIDLALEGNLSSLQAEAIEAELEELSLPQTFDLCVIGSVPRSLREHIEGVGITIFPEILSAAADSPPKGGTKKGVNLDSSAALLDIMEDK